MKLPLARTKKDLTRQLITAVSPLALAVSAALPVAAQMTNDNNGHVLEEIVVTGTRSSLRKSLNLKKDAIGSRDSIVADDIGKMPDTNLAEALQRISGVAITRHNGEGQTISVRGMDPVFTKVTLNGMGVSVASRGPEFGGRNPGRTLDLDLFAAEMFSRVDVNKTQDASMEEGGIGGAVDMYTPKPFDTDGFRMTGTVLGSYGELADEIDPRLTFLISNTFLDDTVGVLFSGAYMERTIQGEGSSSVRWTTAADGGFAWNFPLDGNGNPIPPVGATIDEINNAFVPRLPRSELQQNDRERTSFSAAFQWRPSDSFDLGLDVLYSKMDTDTSIYILDAVFRNQVDVIPLAATIGKNGKLATGIFDNVDRRAENVFVTQETEFLQTVLNANWQAADNLVFSGLLGVSSSDHERPNETSYLFQVVDSLVKVDFTDRLPSIISQDTDLLDPDAYDSNKIRIRPSNIEDDTFAAHLDGVWGDDESSLSFGIAYSTYEKDRVQQRLDIATDDGTTPVSLYSTVIPVRDFASSIGSPAGFPWEHLVADPDLGESVFGVEAANKAAPIDFGNTTNIEEEQLSGYLMLDNVGEFMGNTLRINAGVRVVETTSEAVGAANIDGEISVSKIDRSYTDVLPSMALAWNVTDDVVTRFAFGRTMTRASLSELTPTTDVNIIERSVSRGNPELDPFKSDNVDVSVDWYFAEDAVLSVAYFYKDIQGFIINDTQQIPFSELGIPLDAIDPAENITADTLFEVSQSVNGNGAKVSGFELSYQQQLDFWLPGLGVLANATFTDSDVDFISGDTTVSGALPGLSDVSYNLIGYYETDLWGLRFAYNYRDDFVESSGISDATGLLQTRSDAAHLDASAYYNLNDNFTVLIEAINLTDEEEFTYIGVPSRTHRLVTLGPQYMLGVRIAF